MHRTNSRWLAIATLTLLVVSAQRAVAQQPVSPPTAIHVYVKNMHCESCAKKIRGRLFTVKGVQRVVTHVKKDLAIVEPVPGQSISVRELWERLEDGKFIVDRVETPQMVIATKPES